MPTTMSRADMDRAMDAHFRFELDDDVDGVLGTLHPEVHHDVVGFPGSGQLGTMGAKQFYQQLFQDLQGEKVETQRRYYGDDFMVDESTWSGRAVGRPFGLPGNEQPLSFRILHVIEFADGAIKRENVWIDFASVMAQLGGMPKAPAS